GRGDVEGAGRPGGGPEERGLVRRAAEEAPEGLEPEAHVEAAGVGRERDPERLARGAASGRAERVGEVLQGDVLPAVLGVAPGPFPEVAGGGLPEAVLVVHGEERAVEERPERAEALGHVGLGEVAGDGLVHEGGGGGVEARVADRPGGDPPPLDPPDLDLDGDEERVAPADAVAARPEHAGERVRRARHVHEEADRTGIGLASGAPIGPRGVLADAYEPLLDPPVEALHGTPARVVADEVAVRRQLAETRRARRGRLHGAWGSGRLVERGRRGEREEAGRALERGRRAPGAERVAGDEGVAAGLAEGPAELVLGRAGAAHLGVLEEPEERPVAAELLGGEVALLGRDGEEGAGPAGPRERGPGAVGAHAVGVVLA